MATDQERWDERYRVTLASGVEDRPPAACLLANAALLEDHPRGRALDVACGLGRNALHLARLAFSVDVVDVSRVAIEHVARVASEEDLPVRARQLDLKRRPLPGSGYQVIVNTYFLDRRLYEPLAAALAPGGLLFFETFLPDAEATYGPHDPDHVLRPGEMRTAFPDLEVLDHREGRPSPGSRSVARLVARRPQGGAPVDSP